MDTCHPSCFFGPRNVLTTLRNSRSEKISTQENKPSLVPEEDGETHAYASISDLELNKFDPHTTDMHNSFQSSSAEPKDKGRRIRRSLPAMTLTLPNMRPSLRRPGLTGPKTIRNWIHHQSEGDQPPQEEKTRSSEGRKSSSWIRRAASTTFHRSRRPSEPQHPELPSNGTYDTQFGLYIPRIGVEPPSPLSPAGGAAARAAAAAQNELYENLKTRVSYRLADSHLTNDSESGIGIDIRDKSEDGESTLPITRKDPSLVLPEELIAHIMSYLDATSLMTAELVSRRWNRTATSSHVWSHVFWREHSPSYLSDPESVSISQVGGLGLGKKRGSNQEWKRMWKTRMMLNSRWRNGQAAAIYLEGHKDSVYCAQFDEHKILTGSRDRTIRVWDAHTYKCIKVLGVLKATTHTRVPEPDLEDLGGQKPTISIFPPISTMEMVPDETPDIYHEGSILCLQFDQQTMITGSSDHSCIVWDIDGDDYTPVRRLNRHTAGVLDVCFDDKHIVSCSKDTLICLWDLRTGELLRTLTGHRGPVNAVQLRGNLIVSASGDGVAKLWNLASGLCIKEFPSKDRGLACVEFSLDSRTILAGGNDNVIYQFDANTGELVRELKGHRDLVRSLHLDSANGRVISGSYDTSVKAYDLHSGEMICDFAGWTTSWMFSAQADYRRIVATSQDDRAVIMDFGYGLEGVELLEG